jgi:succinyl-CoA synthetase beta subunit
MRLIEHTSKRILSLYGLASPPSHLCTTADECRRAAEEIGGPVYVKAQIPYGDRAGLGLVARAEGPESAAAQCADMLGRRVEGTPIAAVLVEGAVEPEASMYCSVHVDDASRARVLRLGTGGGGGYRPDDAQVRLAVPSRGLEVFEIRNAVSGLGLHGATGEAATAATSAVIEAALRWHAYTVEVNPLFLTAAGARAIDAKVELDDYSLRNVPDRDLLPERAEAPREREARAFQERDHRGSFRYVQLVPEDEPPRPGVTVVGSHSVGGGESLVVFDALQAVNLTPANYCDTSGAPSREKVAFAAQTIASQPHIAGFFFSSCIANQPLSVTARGLVDGFIAAGWHGPTVVRIAGNQEADARAIVETWAAENAVPATVLGREADEWQAARALATALANGGR